MRSTAVRATFGVLALTVITTACSPGYDREEYITELETDVGVTREQATCIVDRLEVEIGEDRLGSRGEPTDEEIEAVTDATFDCVLGG